MRDYYAFASFHRFVERLLYDLLAVLFKCAGTLIEFQDLWILSSLQVFLAITQASTVRTLILAT